MNVIIKFLIILSAYGVYLAVKRIFEQQKCLEPEIFDLYKKNRLSSSERRRVTRHLGICEECQKIMLEEDDEDLKHLIS